MEQEPVGLIDTLSPEIIQTYNKGAVDGQQRQIIEFGSLAQILNKRFRRETLAVSYLHKHQIY